MEDKNEKYIKANDLSEVNLDYLSKNDTGKDELNSTNKGHETLFISKKEKEVPKSEIENKEVPKSEIKEELKTTEVNNKAEVVNKEVPKSEIKEELDKKNSENKVIKSNSDTNQIPIEKPNQTIKDRLDIKPKVKPKKEIPIEKKPFNEFINEHLIPEIINEFKNRGKVIDVINIKKLDPRFTDLKNVYKSGLIARYLNVTIAGRVRYPGVIRLSRSSTLNDAIDLAGGAKILKGKLTFVRFNKNGTIDKRTFNYNRKAKRGSFKNPILQESDTVFVGESFVSSTSEVISEITRPITGIFSTYGLIKAVSD